MKNCYWCKDYKGKEVPAITSFKAPVDADMGEDGVQVIYGVVGFCEEHLWEYENKEGLFEPYYE